MDFGIFWGPFWGRFSRFWDLLSKFGTFLKLKQEPKTRVVKDFRVFVCTLPSGSEAYVTLLV